METMVIARGKAVHINGQDQYLEKGTSLRHSLGIPMGLHRQGMNLWC